MRVLNMKRAILAGAVSTLMSLPLIANDNPLPDAPDSGKVTFSSSQAGETMVLNNRAFEVRAAASSVLVGRICPW